MRSRKMARPEEHAGVLWLCQTLNSRRGGPKVQIGPRCGPLIGPLTIYQSPYKESRAGGAPRRERECERSRRTPAARSGTPPTNHEVGARANIAATIQFIRSKSLRRALHAAAPRPRLSPAQGSLTKTYTYLRHACTITTGMARGCSGSCTHDHHRHHHPRLTRTPAWSPSTPCGTRPARSTASCPC